MLMVEARGVTTLGHQIKKTIPNPHSCMSQTNNCVICQISSEVGNYYKSWPVSKQR